MTRQASRKAIVLLLGCAVIGMLALGGVFWKRLAATYYLHRLTTEPGYFHEIVDGPEGTARWLALCSFLETRPGKEALFHEYAGAVLEPALAKMQDLYPSRNVLEALVWHGTSGGGTMEELRGRLLTIHAIRVKVDPPERSTVLDRLLPALHGEEFRPPAYPELRFTILPGVESLRMCPRFSAYLLSPGDSDHTCLVRREAQSAIEAMIPVLETSDNVRHVELCLRALGEIGPEARAAAPAIRKAAARQYRHGFTLPHEAAEEALKRILPDG